MAVNESKFRREFQQFLTESFKGKFQQFPIEDTQNNQLYINYDEVDASEMYEFKNEIIEHLETYDFISSAHSLDKLVSSSKLTEYQQLIKNGYHPDRSGDIVFILEPQTIIYGEKGTSHGSGYNYDTHVPLLFYGKGINKGETSIRTEITDIAPTISALLGLEPIETYSGKILDFIIK